jgi:RimJ/RimL family protein N-acetyltransferase
VREAIPARHRGRGRPAAFAFAKTGLTRLEIVAQAGNLRSQRVAEKAGATLECLARNRLVFMANRAMPRSFHWCRPTWDGRYRCMSDLSQRPIKMPW